MANAKPPSKPKNPYYQGPVTDHFDGTRFFNPGGIAPLGFRAMLRWQFNGERQSWQKQVPSPFPQAKPEERIEGDGLRVTMVGHASMLVQVAGLNILTDPVWSDRVSPFSFAGPKRVTAPGIRFEDLPKIDLVLVSHNHYDHLDVVTLKRLQAAHRPHFVTPLGNDTIIRRAAPDAKMSVMDWGDRIAISDAIAIDAEPAHHWSARGTGDRSMALWASFVISTPSGKIYHVGDTGFHEGINYRSAGEKHGLPPRHPALRRLRAALVHEGPAPEPRRSRPRHAASQRRPCGGAPLRDVSADRRGDGRAGEGAGGCVAGAWGGKGAVPAAEGGRGV